MKRWMWCSALCCGLWLGCGTSDDTEQDDPTPPGADGDSCTVLPGLPGSGEYLLKCPDGTQVKLKTARDGEQGDSCTIAQQGDQRVLRCPDGTMTSLGEQGGDSGGKLRVVRRPEPPGAQCPAGGEALELYEEGSAQPLEVFYECSPGCEPGRVWEQRLGRCVTLATVRFEGVVEEGDASILPAPMQPAGGLVPNTTPCAGTYSGPLDLAPLEGQSAGIDVATYVFGHMRVYDLAMAIGGVRYGRDLDVLDPTDLKMSRGKGYGSDPLAAPPLAVTVTASRLAGLEAFDNSKVELRGEVEMDARGPMTHALPASLDEWTPLLRGANPPRLVMEANDFIDGKFVQITCRIERFLPME